MDVSRFCRQSPVMLIAGKGGVGKTTIAAALALTAARAGLSVLVVDLEGKSGLAGAFGVQGNRYGTLGYDEEVLLEATDARGQPGGAHQGEIRARRITPDDALIEYLADHGMRRVSKRLVSSGAVDIVATAIPGIRDILVLGKVKQLERSGAADLIVVDAPATGHAMTFLSSAHGLLDAARSGPVRAQAAEVVEMLTDPTRSQVMLVTLPEEMPVNEVIESAYQLEDRIGVSLAPVVVNSCIPEIPGLDCDPLAAAGEVGVELEEGTALALRSAADFRLRRRALQIEQLERLSQELPLPQIAIPLVSSETISLPDIAVLASALATGVKKLPEDGSASTGSTPASNREGTAEGGPPDA